MSTIINNSYTEEQFKSALLSGVCGKAIVTAFNSDRLRKPIITIGEELRGAKSNGQ